MDGEVLDLLDRARGGDERAREELIATHRGFIHQVASRYCRRSLSWENDDELSVSLLAFNEAVNSYDPALGTSFLSHASTVIHHRLVDWFRRQPSVPVLSLDAAAASDEDSAAMLEVGPATAAYQEEQEALDRVDDLLRYDQALQRYGTSLEELGHICPKHRDTRASLQGAAALLAAEANLMRQLLRSQQLPIRELQQRAGLSRKVLETGRKYVIAVALILWGDEFSHLKSFIHVDPEGGEPQ
ncbi:MAG: RNA polymerase sigma factor SigI [Symbiobacteriia bacterium]